MILRGEESGFLKKSKDPITWVLNTVGFCPPYSPGSKSLVSPVPQTPFHTETPAASTAELQPACVLPRSPIQGSSPASQFPHPWVVSPAGIPEDPARRFSVPSSQFPGLCYLLGAWLLRKWSTQSSKESPEWLRSTDILRDPHWPSCIRQRESSPGAEQGWEGWLSWSPGLSRATAGLIKPAWKETWGSSVVRHVVNTVIKRRKGSGPTRPPSQPGTEPPGASKEFPVPWPTMTDVGPASLRHAHQWLCMMWGWHRSGHCVLAHQGLHIRDFERFLETTSSKESPWIRPALSFLSQGTQIMQLL